MPSRKVRSVRMSSSMIVVSVVRVDILRAAGVLRRASEALGELHARREHGRRRRVVGDERSRRRSRSRRRKRFRATTTAELASKCSRHCSSRWPAPYSPARRRTGCDAGVLRQDMRRFWRSRHVRVACLSSDLRVLSRRRCSGTRCVNSRAVRRDDRRQSPRNWAGRTHRRAAS